MTEKARWSYELSEEMLERIEMEFDIRQLVERFAQATAGCRPETAGSLAEKIFSRYGRDWIRRSVQLGELYTDRTYEVLLEAVDTTGGHLRFPLVPQRVLEIAYLSTHGMELLPVFENSSRRLVYRIDVCKMFETLKAVCGDAVAEAMPCRYACLNACRTLFADMDYPDVRIEMAASTGSDGYCKFIVARA